MCKDCEFINVEILDLRLEKRVGRDVLLRVSFLDGKIIRFGMERRRKLERSLFLRMWNVLVCIGVLGMLIGLNTLLEGVGFKFGLK